MLHGYHHIEFKTRSDTDDAHGGIALLIKEHLNYVKRDDLAIFIPHVIESLFVEVHNGRAKPNIVGVIYRLNTLPRADLDLFIKNLLEIQGTICNENKTAYLIVDYNINLLKFGSHKKNNDFIDNVISQGFVPYILKPTIITATSATLIDHIFSNHTSPDHESGIIVTYIADHFGIFHITYGIAPKIKPTRIRVRQLKYNNILAFKNRLATTDLSGVLKLADPDDAYNYFFTYLLLPV